jgi:hypothetical protein
MVQQKSMETVNIDNEYNIYQLVCLSSPDFRCLDKFPRLDLLAQ